jgi:monoterpene epsilon-lactone hydrolase
MSAEQLNAIIVRFGAMKARWGTTVTLQQMRSDLDDLYASYAPAPGFNAEPVCAGGVNAEWVAAPGLASGQVILYFHGGGFAVGSLRGSRHYAAQLSAATRTPVLVLDYRLAPEHTFPAQIEDAEAAYRWLLSLGKTGAQIALQGDSAGACLALALLARLRSTAAPMPACAALLTPWADLRCQGQSYDTLKDEDPVANREMALMMAATYLGASGKAEDPRATPVLDDFTGFCPLLIQAAARDVFRDDARAIHACAGRAGVLCEIEEWPGMIHQWQLYAADLAEGRQALEKVNQFLSRHFKR